MKLQKMSIYPLRQKNTSILDTFFLFASCEKKILSIHPSLRVFLSTFFLFLLPSWFFPSWRSDPKISVRFITGNKSDYNRHKLCKKPITDSSKLPWFHHHHRVIILRTQPFLKTWSYTHTHTFEFPRNCVGFWVPVPPPPCHCPFNKFFSSNRRDKIIRIFYYFFLSLIPFSS